MRRLLIPVLFVSVATWTVSAQRPAQAPAAAPMLTVDSIMRGPKLVGNPPSAVRWSKDSSKIYFSWQKPDQDRAATFTVAKDGSGLREMTAEEARTLDLPQAGRFDRARKRALVAENGDVVVYDVGAGSRRVLIRTSAAETSPRWARNDTAVTFMRDGNLYLMALDGRDTPLVQLTDIVTPEQLAAAGGNGGAGRGAAAVGGGGGQRGTGAGAAGQAAGGRGATTNETDVQRYLREQERELLEFVKRQAEQGRGGAAAVGGGRGGRGGAPGGGTPSTPIARLALGARQTLVDVVLSTDERYAYVAVNEGPEGAARGQGVPNYITETSYPELMNGRTNVGDVQARRLLAVVDLKEANRTVWADAAAFAGVERKAKPADPDKARVLDWGLPEMSDDGSQAVVTVSSQDNKDRWLVRVDPATGKASVLDTVHDDAWIRTMGIAGGATAGAGFGGGGGVTWLPDNKRLLFAAEKEGYMHVYSLDVTAATPQAKPLTSGKWEVTTAQISADRKMLFLQTNEVHPGERQFYTMSVEGGPRTKVTTMVGSSDVTVSPDEKSLALVYSYSTKPPELYVMPFTPEAPAKQVTTSSTEEWRNFKWIDPKVITYKSRDGMDVYARLYTPEMIGAKRDPKKPAVIFVHGAGYLQNAHKYWSTYFREYMFHNLLASRGYVVLDPDYRASSGYGRDWRTAIYRHMGGHDLEDVVDGAKYLVAAEKVDAKRIGVYGGSYGGFITLMAMFTTPDVFAAGAALRPVTDWAHYNHGYTSNILNVPYIDPEAYKQSSPIYFAQGLKNRLLILHGMVDTNVFFQDSVRLVQRLIELRKENWEIAPFPVENHSFTEETSWADEYKRILKLFEETLRR